MNKKIKISLLVVLLLIAFPLLIVTLADVFDFGITTAEDHPKYSSDEIYQGIKNSFDNNVVPAMEEGIQIITDGIKDPEKVFDEFSGN